jgi:hypothetical protein
MKFFPCHYAKGGLFAAYPVSDIRKILPYNDTTSVLYIGPPGAHEDDCRKIEVFMPIAGLIDLLNEQTAFY